MWLWVSHFPVYKTKLLRQVALGIHKCRTHRYQWALEHIWIWVSKPVGEGVLETIPHGYQGTTVHYRSCWKKKKQDYAYNVNSRAYIWQIIHVLFVPHHSVLTWTYHVQGTILNALSKVTIQGQAGSQTQVARFKAKASNHYFARQKCRKLTSEITIYWFLSTRAMDLKVWSLD